MPSGTDLGKLIIRQALPRGASVKPQMKVLDGDPTSLEVLFVPKSGLTVTGFVLVGAGLEAPILEGTVVTDSNSGGVRSILSVKTGTPRIGFKYKLYAKTASGTETKQPSATVVYDGIFGWSPVKKSSAVQNLEVKGDTVFGMDGTNSKAQFKGTGGVTVSGATTIAGGLISSGTTFLTGQTNTQAIAVTKLDVTGASTLAGRVDTYGFCRLGGVTTIASQSQAIDGNGIAIGGSRSAPLPVGGSQTINVLGNKIILHVVVNTAFSVVLVPSTELTNGSGNLVIPYAIGYNGAAFTAIPDITTGNFTISVPPNQSDKKIAVLFI